MLKTKIFFISALLCAINLNAAETASGWHAPKTSEFVRDLLQRHAQRSDKGVVSSTLTGVERGANAPFHVTDDLSSKTFEAAKNSGSVVELTVNTAATLFTSIGGFIGSMITAIPAAAVGGLVGLKDGTINSVKNVVEKETFQNAVALNLYLWVQAIDVARANLRGQIKTWQQNHNQDSIKQALESMIRNNSINNFAQESGTTNDQLLQLLSNVEKKNDNWKNFFQTLSKNVEIPEFAGQYQVLADKLINWPKKTDAFPQVSDNMMKENIAFAVWFFNIAVNNDLDILRTFLRRL